MVNFCRDGVAAEAAEDADLMRAVADGDSLSFAKVYQRFAGVVHTTIYKILNDRQDTEDVMQEVFWQIWRKARLYEPSKGRALSWVATMARNRAIDHLRSMQRRARLREEFGEESTGFELAVEPRNSVDAALANEQSAIVRDAVLQLSWPQREAIELAYFSGMTQKEIALRLGEPLGTIKARIRRGVIKLYGSVSRGLL